VRNGLEDPDSVGGFDPDRYGLTGMDVDIPEQFRIGNWYARQDSNLRPPA
jgi:hypothetical protein